MTPDELLKALNIPSHEEPDVGDFFQGLDGRWRHTCSADFPFQADVELIFDMSVKSAHLPKTMPANVLWIQEHLIEIWNAAAAVINDLTTAQQIQLEGDFKLEPLHFKLPDAPVENGAWRMSMEPSGLHGSFDITFKGLAVIGQRYSGI